MRITDAVRLFYGIYLLLVSSFMVWFVFKVKRKGNGEAPESERGIDRRELGFFAILLLAVIAGHVITLSDWVPWERWRLWSRPAVAEKYNIQMGHYKFNFPNQPMVVKAGRFVEFDVTSTDVTYGFGVFRKDGSLVFQEQVLPGYNNKYVWNFSDPGYYDVRSTEYSGDKHSQMYAQNVLHVLESEEAHR
ncbi:MAG: cupredoxin domain-containing protein [Acidobacteriaceae bacterium]